MKPKLKGCSPRKQCESKQGEADHVLQLDESVPKGHAWYSLRRGATTLAGISRDPLASKGLLRHSNLATTERHYIKDVAENTLQAMNQLERLLNDCSTVKH